MKQKILSLFVIMLWSITMYGKSNQKIEIPSFNDKFSIYVQQLEAGQLDIDFQDFRFSFLESQQFKVAKDKSSDFDKLEKELYKHVNKSNYLKIITITMQMLSIDYTSMIAHKMLRQTYEQLGDTINAEKYKTIQFGLLKSIVRHGDGKTAETAWPVIQIDEEYFILRMLGAKLMKQELVGNQNLCDRMTVTEEGETKVYYFNVDKVFESSYN